MCVCVCEVLVTYVCFVCHGESVCVSLCGFELEWLDGWVQIYRTV